MKKISSNESDEDSNKLFYKVVNRRRYISRGKQCVVDGYPITLSKEKQIEHDKKVDEME